MTINRKIINTLVCKKCKAELKINQPIATCECPSCGGQMSVYATAKHKTEVDLNLVVMLTFLISFTLVIGVTAAVICYIH